MDSLRERLRIHAKDKNLCEIANSEEVADELRRLDSGEIIFAYKYGPIDSKGFGNMRFTRGRINEVKTPHIWLIDHHGAIGIEDLYDAVPVDSLNDERAGDKLKVYTFQTDNGGGYETIEVIHHDVFRAYCCIGSRGCESIYYRHTLAAIKDLKAGHTFRTVEPPSREL